MNEGVLLTASGLATVVLLFGHETPCIGHIAGLRADRTMVPEGDAVSERALIVFNPQAIEDVPGRGINVMLIGDGRLVVVWQEQVLGGPGRHGTGHGDRCKANATA